MEKTITFSAMPVATDELAPLLIEFERQFSIKVRVREIPWDRERAEIAGIAFQRQDVDVSMVGMPMTSDLIGMNALRPFRPDEIAALGGASTFLPSRWQSGMRPGSSQVWAIPWLVDFRALYYWPEMLDRSVVDLKTAFTDQSMIEATIQALARSGVSMPWAVPSTSERYLLLHAVSSWIWAAGGVLFRPDGKQVEFHSEEAVAGMVAYFNLLKYIPRRYQNSKEDELFMKRQAALTISGGWVALKEPQVMRCVPAPGAGYLGGTDLVIWSHSSYPDAAFELIRYLTAPENSSRVAVKSGFVSPRMSELTVTEGEADSLHASQVRAVLAGRAYPCIPLIGLVEDRLSSALAQIQRVVFSGTEQDLHAIIRANIEPLANRINLSLSQ